MCFLITYLQIEIYLCGIIPYVRVREMEYKELTSCNTFYPLQKKHQIHFKMLYTLKTQNVVKFMIWARLTRDQ